MSQIRILCRLPDEKCRLPDKKQCASGGAINIHDVEVYADGQRISDTIESIHWTVSAGHPARATITFVGVAIDAEVPGRDVRNDAAMTRLRAWAKAEVLAGRRVHVVSAKGELVAWEKSGDWWSERTALGPTGGATLDDAIDAIYHARAIVVPA